MERKYARELAEIEVRAFFDFLARNWAEFAGSDYQAWDIMQKKGITDLGLKKLRLVAELIDRAKRDGYVLDLNEPYEMLVPWAKRRLEYW